MTPRALLTVVVSCCLLAAVTLVASGGEVETDWNNCMPAPYLYITFGSNDKNYNSIVRYSRDGCNLGPVIHSDDAKKLDNPVGLALIPAIGDNDYMLVTNGGNNDAAVALFGSCNTNDNNYRTFLSNLVVESSTNPGLSSPYSVRVTPQPTDFSDYANSSLYVSNRDTGVITYYSLATGEPRPTSSYLSSNGQYPPGSFVSIDSSVKGANFHGFAFDSAGNLWAADGEQFVLQFSGTTGSPGSQFPADTPINVDFFEARGQELIFVSLNPDDNDDDAVYAYDPTTFQIVIKYNQKLDHPTGFVAFDDILYVLSSNANSVVTFNLTTGHNLDVITNDLPSEPVSVVLAYC